MLKTLFHRFDLHRPLFLFPISYGLIVLIGIVDYLTGTNISLSIFYLVPISLVAWYGTNKSGYIIAVAGAVIWLIIDISGLISAAGSPLPYWNALVRLGFFIITVILISRIKNLNARLVNLLEETTTAWSKEVAQHKRTEWTLSATESQFRSIIGSLNNVYFILDSKGRLTYVSQYLVEKSGYMEKELIGMLYVRLIAPEDSLKVIQYYNDASNNGALEATFKFRIKTKQGEIIWVEQSTRIVRDSNAVILEYHNIVRDITTEKKTEEQLILLAHAVASTSQMIYITDLQNHFIFVNKAFQDMYGYTESEIVGTTPKIIFSEKNDSIPLHIIFEQTINGGWRGEIIHRKNNGAEFRVFLSTSPIKNFTGGVIGLIGVATDITEKYAAQEAIRLSEMQFRTVVETISDGLIRIDTNDTIEYANNRFCEMLGYYSDEIVLHRSVESFFREQDLGFYRRQIMLRKNGKMGSYEIQIKKKSNELLWVQISASPILNSKGKFIGSLGVVTDVSDRKKAEQTLQNAEARLNNLFLTDANDSDAEEIELTAHETSQFIEELASRIDTTIRRMEMMIKRVISFSSMSSHELRTPLTIIRNQLEETMVANISVEQMRSNITEVYDETLRLRHTVDHLLAIGSMLSGSFKLDLEPLDVRTFLNKFYDEAVLLTRDKNISVVYSHRHQAIIKGNELMLRQVMFNLLDNAIKFTPAGGKIHLDCAVEQQTVVIHFSDTGSGISSNDLEHVFDTFWRGGNVDGVGGTGLGLTLVKLVVEAHNGSIDVQSDKGKGTSFSISFPLVHSNTT